MFFFNAGALYDEQLSLGTMKANSGMQNSFISSSHRADSPLVTPAAASLNKIHNRSVWVVKTSGLGFHLASGFTNFDRILIWAGLLLVLQKASRWN